MITSRTAKTEIPFLPIRTTPFLVSKYYVEIQRLVIVAGHSHVSNVEVTSSLMLTFTPSWSDAWKQDNLGSHFSGHCNVQFPTAPHSTGNDWSWIFFSHSVNFQQKISTELARTLCNLILLSVVYGSIFWDEEHLNCVASFFKVLQFSKTHSYANI